MEFRTLDQRFTEKKKCVNLSKINGEMIEQVKDDEGGLKEQIANEYYDTNFRGELWNKCLSMVEDCDENERLSKLREIINVDKNLFDFFLTKNRNVLAIQIKDQILDDLTKKTSMRKKLVMYDEFNSYLESMISVNKIFNKIINLFKMCDFYLSIKNSNTVCKIKNKSKPAPWDMKILVKSLGLKSLNFFMNSTSYFMKLAFKNNRTWKSLMSLSLITLLRSNPAAFAFGLNLSYGSILIPLVGKVIQWSGVFDKITDLITVKEMVLYIGSLQSSCEQTYKILRKYYELVVKDFEEVLQTEGHGAKECEEKLVEKLEIFNKKFSDLEKFIENEVVGVLKVEDVGDGWMMLTEEAKELSMTRYEGFDKVF